MLYKILIIMTIIISLAGFIFGVFFWKVPDAFWWKFANVAEIVISLAIFVSSGKFYIQAFVSNYD